MVKTVAYAIVLWAVPFLVAIPLLPLMKSDPTFFKTIMIVVGTATGSALAAIYFRGVTHDFLRQGIVLGVVWIAVNWLLDFAILLPLSGMSPDRYFLEIGLRYLAILFTTTAIGYVLNARTSGGKP